MLEAQQIQRERSLRAAESAQRVVPLGTAGDAISELQQFADVFGSLTRLADVLAGIK